MKYTHCSVCKRNLPTIRHARQKYCDESLRDCAKIANKEKLKERYIPSQRQCRTCRKMVTEPGMKKQCKQCVQEAKDAVITEHECMSEGCTRMVRTKRHNCSICLKKIGRKYYNKIVKDDIIEEPKKKSLPPIKEKSKAVKKVEPYVDPKWTQPRGSKRR